MIYSITCPICGENLGGITPSHLKRHDMTTEEFRKQYPKVLMYSTLSTYEPKPFTIPKKKYMK